MVTVAEVDPAGMTTVVKVASWSVPAVAVPLSATCTVNGPLIEPSRLTMTVAGSTGDAPSLARPSALAMVTVGRSLSAMVMVAWLAVGEPSL